MRNVVLMSLGVWLAGSALNVFACDQGFQAFKTTVYTKVRQDCALCHDGSNPKAPPFGTTDAQKSYDHLTHYLDAFDPGSSLLVVRAGNGHCQIENCDADSGKEMAQLVKQWVDGGEKNCPRIGQYVTPSMDIPANLPDPDHGFATISFDLGQIKSDLAGLSLQIGMQSVLGPSDVTKGLYRFHAPRIVGGKKSVYLKNMRVHINGRYDVVYDGYSTLDREFPFVIQKGDTTGATPVLSTENLLILKDGVANSKVSVSFDAIETRTTDIACTNGDAFAKYVMPVVQSNKCATCHKAGATDIGAKLFDATLTPAKLCGIATSLVDSNYFMASPLVLIPSQGAFNHPAFAKDDDRYAYVAALKTWLGK